jgi:PIN domain nuclease of toxin-antitoxin system
VRLLLDTHVLLWTLSNSDKLTAAHRSLIEDGTNEVWVSSVSIAEIAVKASRGKLSVPDDFVDAITAQAFAELPFRTTHAIELRDLPLHHRDPFDRMLVSQARSEDLVFLTTDVRIREYDVELG